MSDDSSMLGEVTAGEQKETAHNPNIDADFFTNFATVIKGGLYFIATAYWFANLIDEIFGISGPVLGYSVWGAVIGFIVSIVLTACDTYCHRKQDQLSQNPVNFSKQVYQNKLSTKTQLVAYGAALADVIAVAGLLTSLVSETYMKIVKSSLPEWLNIAVLAGTFVLGLVACVSEYRTHKKALQEVEAIEKSKSGANSEIELHDRSLTSQLTSTPTLTPQFNATSIAEGSTRTVIPRPASSSSSCCPDWSQIRARLPSVPSISGMFGRTSANAQKTQRYSVLSETSSLELEKSRLVS